MRKRIGGVVLLVATIAAAAGLLASTSHGAAKGQRTIGLVVPASTPDSYSTIGPWVESGARAAANTLGDDLAIKEAPDASTETDAIESLIAQHVSAIAVDNEQYDSGVARALTKARKAGIPTLSFEKPYPGSVWVSSSTSAQFAHALADAVASQIGRRGTYVIVSCSPADPIVASWQKTIKTYVRHRYSRMHLAGVVTGGDGNGPAGSLLLRPLLRKHPHVRGLIFLCQDEAYNGPPQLIHLHEVGKVFSSGNGNSYAPPVVEPWATSVQSGAEEIVTTTDPVKLGYLAVWAADHLAGGETLTPGSYGVGGPVGTVRYYGQHKELRLGQPLTITKSNLAQYTG
jgi:ABC-type sugar transport system substrate-binding protein